MPALPLGYDPETGLARWLPGKDRNQSTYILGAAGLGKTAVTINMVVADVTAGNAVFLIDPHGDAVDAVLERLPQSCLHRVSVLDMLDEEYPFGINIFSEAATMT